MVPDLQPLSDAVRTGLDAERKRQALSAGAQAQLQARIAATVSASAATAPVVFAGAKVWAVATIVAAGLGAGAFFTFRNEPDPAPVVVASVSPARVEPREVAVPAVVEPAVAPEPIAAVVPEPVVAAPRPSDATCRAVGFLARAQRDFKTTPGPVRASWTWRTSDADPAPNTAGIVAHAVGVEGTRCGLSQALTAFARERADEQANWQTLYDGDVEALALAGQSGESRYREIAKQAFERRHGGANGREIVERWFMVRKDPTLVGFDAAQAIRAALAVGEKAKAIEIADAIASQAKRWTGFDENGYLSTSVGALLEAFLLIDARRYIAMPAVVELRDNLILTQGRDGSWNGKQTQATAYAVRALSLLSDRESRYAAEKGRKWLAAKQRPDGSWPSHGDAPPDDPIIYEVVAEAALAMQQR